MPIVRCGYGEGVKMRTEKTATYWATIYISGPLSVIEQTCRQECMKGLCVTVDPTRFIYTGGEETGAAIGLVNYPRFPVSNEDLYLKAECLALTLLETTCQHSVMIVTPDKTVWHTKREA